MKGLAPGIVLACISLILMEPVAAFGQQAGKGQFNSQANLQNAVAYCNRGYAKLRKGDLDGAIADFNRAIKLHAKHAPSATPEATPSATPEATTHGQDRNKDISGLLETGNNRRLDWIASASVPWGDAKRDSVSVGK